MAVERDSAYNLFVVVGPFVTHVGRVLINAARHETKPVALGGQ